VPKRKPTPERPIKLMDKFLVTWLKKEWRKLPQREAKLYGQGRG
jgi:hypothetical protein